MGRTKGKCTLLPLGLLISTCQLALLLSQPVTLRSDITYILGVGGQKDLSGRVLAGGGIIAVMLGRIYGE